MQNVRVYLSKTAWTLGLLCAKKSSKIAYFLALTFPFLIFFLLLQSCTRQTLIAIDSTLVCLFGLLLTPSIFFRLLYSILSQLALLLFSPIQPYQLCKAGILFSGICLTLYCHFNFLTSLFVSSGHISSSALLWYGCHWERGDGGGWGGEAFSSAPSFPTSYMSFLLFEKSPPAPTIQAATVVWSALTTRWPKCWLWSSTNAKTIGTRSYRTWSSPTIIRSVPPLAWPPTRFTLDRLPRLPLTIFDRYGVVGHRSLARDHLAYCDRASERLQRANDTVREMHALTVSRVEQRASALSDALRQVPNFVVGNWVWLYNPNGERSLAPGYGGVPRADWLRH